MDPQKWLCYWMAQKVIQLQTITIRYQHHILATPRGWSSRSLTIDYYMSISWTPWFSSPYHQCPEWDKGSRQGSEQVWILGQLAGAAAQYQGDQARRTWYPRLSHGVRYSLFHKNFPTNFESNYLNLSRTNDHGRSIFNWCREGQTSDYCYYKEIALTWME